MKKLSWTEVHQNKTQIETREFKATKKTPEVGHTYFLIKCPFCDSLIKAFVWSLAGTGKSCDCGALFDRYTHTEEKKTQLITRGRACLSSK